MQDVAEALRQVELFHPLDDATLAGLAERTFTRRLSKGQVLFLEGEPTGHLFVVLSGRLRVFVSSPHGDDLVLTMLSAGESLGEASVLSGEARSASVDAVEPSELLAVPIEDVRRVLLENPEALLATAGRLAATVRRVTGTAADLVFLDVPRRLAKLLVAQANVDARGVAVCDLGLSQSGVAAHIGATRQSLNRALGEFAKRGWITVDGTSVRLDDREALRRFADS